MPAAIFGSNGFGKLAGSTQVMELGNIETPIVLTNTLNVSTAMNTVISYTLQQKGNENVQSVNALVGETNDGWLNDIRGRHLKEQDILSAIENAGTNVTEGNVGGAATGTVCFGYKGGIGTASRKFPESLGGYTVGVLVQTNYGGVLQIDGVPVGGEAFKKFSFSNQLLNNVDGSCMIIIATDAPLDSRNLERLAARSILGLGRTGVVLPPMEAENMPLLFQPIQHCVYSTSPICPSAIYLYCIMIILLNYLWQQSKQLKKPY